VLTEPALESVVPLYGASVLKQATEGNLRIVAIRGSDGVKRPSRASVVDQQGRNVGCGEADLGIAAVDPPPITDAMQGFPFFAAVGYPVGWAGGAQGSKVRCQTLDWRHLIGGPRFGARHLIGDT